MGIYKMNKLKVSCQVDSNFPNIFYDTTTIGIASLAVSAASCSDSRGWALSLNRPIVCRVAMTIKNKTKPRIKTLTGDVTPAQSEGGI